jgi:NAD-dependent dihydropyrimidine dehydrogenase PreA subunit
MIRKIIEIDEDKCDGCEQCIPACPEGAIQLIDGKAKLVRDFYCDGLGACLGHCPQGAINVIEREADEYDERKVMENVITQGDEVVKQHLEHLREHGEKEYLQEAMNILEEKGQKTVGLEMQQPRSSCPGSQSLSFSSDTQNTISTSEIPSALHHWPIQLHLLSPMAPHYKGSQLLLAADCVPFALANFHQGYLTGKTLAIACPKLDQGQQIYIEKLKILIDQSEIESISVMVMQVPCCSGLVQLVQTAMAQSKRSIPAEAIVVGIQGQILKEQPPYSPFNKGEN